MLETHFLKRLNGMFKNRKFYNKLYLKSATFHLNINLEILKVNKNIIHICNCDYSSCIVDAKHFKSGMKFVVNEDRFSFVSQFLCVDLFSSINKKACLQMLTYTNGCLLPQIRTVFRKKFIKTLWVLI
jgi:hypothetical protein